MLSYAFTVKQLGMLQSSSELRSRPEPGEPDQSPVPRSGMGLKLVNLSGPGLNPKCKGAYCSELHPLA